MQSTLTLARQSVYAVAWLVGGVVVGVICRHNDPTPAGSVLLRWNLPPDVRTVGARTSVERTYVVTLAREPVTLKVHVDTATVTPDHDGLPMTAPISITATVEDSGGFTLSLGDCLELVPEGGGGRRGAIACMFGGYRTELTGARSKGTGLFEVGSDGLVTSL